MSEFERATIRVLGVLLIGILFIFYLIEGIVLS